MTNAEALAAARRILGPRVKVYRDGDECVIERKEYSTGLMPVARVYGRATTWETALSRAEQGYDDMKTTARKGKR